MAFQNKQGEAITGINVTPLVDITLVLLIIFMATCHLIAHRAMNLNLPKAQHTEATPTPSVQVMISADRSITLNGQTVTRQELALNLAQMARIDPGVKVTLSADKTIDWDTVAGLLDDIRGAGVTRLAAQVENK